MSNIELSIVIPVFNNWNFTKSCLIDLSYLPDNHQIVIVDNCSTDQTSDQLGLGNFKQHHSNLHYIRLDQNYGFAHACNIGYDIASGDNVMFLNNDIRVKQSKNNWTDVLLNKCKDAIVGPTGGLLDKNLNFIQETNTYIESPFFYMSGWNLTSSKDIWKKLILPEYIGPFAEYTGLAYFEDTDLSFRARQLGIRFEIIDLPVHHFGKMTSKNLNTSMLYTIAKSKFVEKWKHLK